VVSTFYFIRHAEKNAPESVLSGRTDIVHLTEHGRRQAEALAAQLAELPLAQVFSSPARRARETAAPLVKTGKFPLQISAAFHEVDFGAWTNISFERLERDPRWLAYNTYRGVTPIPGGESIRQVQRRFVSQVREIAAHFPNDHVAVFSHREPIVAAVLYFIGLTLDAWPRFAVDPASVTTLTLRGEQAQIVNLNDTSATRKLVGVAG
jgi:broad specificity phosphatase PhoE